MTRTCIVSGAILGGLAVAGGAFGAHGLRDALEAAGQTANWETAFRYALVHAIALVATGLVAALPAAGRSDSAVRGKSPPWPFATVPTGRKAEVFAGRQSPHPPSADLFHSLLGWAGMCFALGTLVFSGCLAALAVTGVRVLGAVVPIGGALLIAGWALLAIGAARIRCD